MRCAVRHIHMGQYLDQCVHSCKEFVWFAIPYFLLMIVGTKEGIACQPSRVKLMVII